MTDEVVPRASYSDESANVRLVNLAIVFDRLEDRRSKSIKLAYLDFPMLGCETVVNFGLKTGSA